MILLLLVLLLWPVVAHAEPCTIRIEGPVAIITCLMPSTAPPVVLPPVVVPPVPPVVTPPACDPAPFVYPGTCRTDTDGLFRFYELGSLSSGPFYAGFPYEGSPSSSHMCAGLMGPGAKSAWGSKLEGMMLWVPRQGTRGCDIRCALATGRPCP